MGKAKQWNIVITAFLAITETPIGNTHGK